MTNKPSIGAHVMGGAVEFLVWAPRPANLELVVEGVGTVAMQPGDGDYWSATVPGAGTGTRYGYLVDGAGPFPDPASRSQPDGVHGLSETIDFTAFPWTDADWSPPPVEDVVIYELHVGTFTEAGTFAAAIDRLPWLRDLGVTTIELMPIAAFPGRWNWGYDGVALFAPFAGYGTPEDLCRFVDAAHAHGLAVILDVVFNHFGPDGNYTGLFADAYLDAAQQTPWGGAVNFAAPQVREFYRENILMWLHGYHLDGFRFDATHTLVDSSGEHILRELATVARADSRPGITPLLVAETHENDARYVDSGPSGYRFDAVWADDFHHCARTTIVEEHEGYFRSFDGSLEQLAACIEQGFLFEGQPDAYGHVRGKPARDIPWSSFVYCLQNHDQVGNRAFGERLSATAAHADVRALTTLLLLLPQVPMLFQGQEFFASTPFLYFTDHSEPLGSMVVEGRRGEFGAFTSFHDERVRELMPSPQEKWTFRRSKLNWDESLGAGAVVATLHRELLSLRREHPVLIASRRQRAGLAATVQFGALVVTISNGAGRAVIAVNLGSTPVAVPLGLANPAILLSSEEGRFGGSGRETEVRGGFLTLPGHCATLNIEG